MESFNGSIKRMFKRDPSNKTLAIIEQFKQKGKYKDYYIALDSLGFKVGVEYIVDPVLDEESGIAVSYMSSLKFHKGNPFNGNLKLLNSMNSNQTIKHMSILLKNMYID